MRLKGQEEREQREWERARWMVWRQLSPYYKQGQAPRTPQAFFRFPWEVESREDMQERYERCKPTAAELEWLNRLTSKHES